MKIDKNKALSMLNQKSALVFFVRKKFLKPIYLGKIKKFSGYQTFLRFRSNGYESFEIDLQMDDGEATIILVQQDQYYVLAENNTSNSMNLDLDKGWFKLRIIGQNASLNFTIKRYSK